MPGACAAPNCRYNTKKLHVFRFPRDVRRCNQWLISCNRLDLMEKSPKYLNTHCRLCEKHFEDDQFMNACKSRLIWKAIPTIFDASDPPESEKRKRFKHSFLSAKRKRIASLGQSCSVDHTYFAIPDKSAQTKRMKTNEPDPGTVCDMSGNMSFVLINAHSNIARLFECSGYEATTIQAVDTEAGSVDASNVTVYCDSSSFGTIIDNRSQTENVTCITDPYIANVSFQSTSSDVTFLTDGNICTSSNIISDFNANTNAITFYNTLIRDEGMQDSRNMNIEDSANTDVRVINFQEEVKDGTSEQSMTESAGDGVRVKTSSIKFCDTSSGYEALLTKQSLLPEMASSVQCSILGSQKYTTAADIPAAADYVTAAAATVCGSSRSAAVSSRKRRGRKVLASSSSEMAADSVDHTYAANIPRKSFQGEGECSCETFSKEQGMMLVKKILSMQKQASVAAKRSKTKSEIPTIESIVQGAVQLGMKDSTSRFFASQLRNCMRNNKGHRWSALDKSFARDLFAKSKEAYKVLEDFFHLPSAATLQRHARGRNTAGLCFEGSDET